MTDGGAVALMGVEIDDHHLANTALVVEHLGSEGDVGIDAEPAAPVCRGMVIPAAQVDRDPGFERGPARQDRAPGGVAHRSEDSPVDHPAGSRSTTGTSRMRASVAVRFARECRYSGRVDLQQVATADWHGPDEIPTTSEALGR